MISTAEQPWGALPAEMKFAIAEHLDLPDLKSLSKVNRQAYLLCVPTLFRVSTHIFFAYLCGGTDVDF